jgi:hypothetical protein
MPLAKFLKSDRVEIINEALSELDKTRLKHYSESDKDTNAERLKNLYNILIESVETKSLIEICKYCEDLAEKRFNSGFDLYEVQSTINVLEEVIWKKIIKYLPPSEYERALGMITTVLGAGKDSLACKYVSLASQCKKPTLDLSELFKNRELS